MASQPALRASPQVPNRNLVPSLPVFLLHFLQRGYGSVCHHLFIPLTNNAKRRKKAVQNGLVILGTGLLLLLISVSDNPAYTAVDYEILKRVQEVSNKELCLQNLRGFPFVVRSLDLEVGVVLNGTLLFRFSPTVQKFTADVTFAEVARKRREIQRNNSRTKQGGDVLKHSPELSKQVQVPRRAYMRYNHTKSQSVLSQTDNQIKRPVSAHSFFRNGREYDDAFTGQASVKGKRRHSHEKTLGGSDSATSTDSTMVEADGKEFQFTQSDAHVSVPKKRVENQNAHSDPLIRDSKNNAKSYKRSIKSKLHSTQTRNSYKGVRQPSHKKQHSPKDDFITRASRKRVFDDVIVTSRSWEPIAEDDGNLFVYSAFYDDRPSRHVNGTRRVRVLGISVLHELRDFPHLRTQVFCHYRWKSTHRLHVSQRGKIMSIWEDHNKTYHAVFIICELHLCGSPDYVGITVDRDVLPLTYLPIKYPARSGDNFKHGVTTCFPVMHSHYSNKLELLQVLEADRILGAEKFTLYLYSASPEVLAIIRHYVTSGVMEAIEWRLPFTDVSLVHYFGQMAAINDCLYNSQYTSRYVVFHDFDELLFPRMHDTWNQMLGAIRRQEETWMEWWRQWRHGQYGSYTFLHVCFPKNWTHPGLPGDVIIEGSDVAVQPGAVEPFVYGHIAILPSAKDEMKSNKEKDEVGGEKALGDEHAARQGISETTQRRRLGEVGGGKRGQINDSTKTAGQTEKGNALNEWRSWKNRASLRDMSNEEPKPRSNGADNQGVLSQQTTIHRNQKRFPRVQEARAGNDIVGKNIAESWNRGDVKGRVNDNPEPSRNAASGESPNEEKGLNFGDSIASRPLKRQAVNSSRHRHESLLNEAVDKNKDAVSNARSELQDSSLSNLAVGNEHHHPNDDKQLATLRYTWRENLVWAPDWRSKMLVKPSTVEMMGIHSVHMHIKGYQSKNLAAKMALVHHYRMWWVRNGTAMIHDTSAYRLASRLTANVDHVLKKVLGVQLNNEN